MMVMFDTSLSQIEPCADLQICNGNSDNKQENLAFTFTLSLRI
jgi:hypothetical protein